MKKHRHIKGWDFSWFLDRILRRDPDNDRYGWFNNTVIKYLTVGMKVLDMCGGVGMFGTYLKVIEGFNFDYTVMDMPYMKEIAEDYFKTFEVQGNFVTGSILQPLAFTDSTFDMVWTFSWCQITLDVEKYFKEVYRVLKPNGLFFFNMAYGRYETVMKEEEIKAMATKLQFKVEILELGRGSELEYLVLLRK